jgi:crotonobetainyl-CoA:carnitine CoA-transferase CaiB-like acyl-CoA transferase
MIGLVEPLSPPPLLDDLRVLDLSATLPGPFCTQLLADLGAHVIRVESPAGDFLRSLPSRMYEAANRNKRSLVLNLHDPAHLAAMHRVATTVDVVVEGFRPGVADRLGIGFEQLKALNDRLVYCSISGFGQEGPERNAPGHDLIYLAAAGLLDFSGHWLERGRRAGAPVSDLAAAAYAAVAILAALHGRATRKAATYIDLAITDVAMALTSVRAGPRFDLRGEERLHLFPANELFTAADGVCLAVAAVEEHFWAGLRDVVGLRDPRINSPDFATNELRWRHGNRLVAVLEEVFATESSTVWLTELRAVDVPVQPVLSAEEAMAAAEQRQRQIVVESDGIRHVPFPARRDGAPMAVPPRAAPALGADTAEVLRECGVPEETLARILAES